MKRYTLKRHVQVLKDVVLPAKHPEVWCPAAVTRDGKQNGVEDYRCCKICRSFVGLTPQGPRNETCPCHELGTKEAVRRAKEAIKKWEEK